MLEHGQLSREIKGKRDSCLHTPTPLRASRGLGAWLGLGVYLFSSEMSSVKSSEYKPEARPSKQSRAVSLEPGGKKWFQSEGNCTLPQRTCGQGAPRVPGQARGADPVAQAPREQGRQRGGPWEWLHVKCEPRQCIPTGRQDGLVTTAQGYIDALADTLCRPLSLPVKRGW